MSAPSLRSDASHCALEVRGKFLWCGGEKHFARMVTYGPFPDASCGEDGMLPPRDVVESDLRAVRGAGFNAVRLYEVPPEWFVEICGQLGLKVWFGVPWGWHLDFLSEREDRRHLLAEGREQLQRAVRRYAGSPVIGGIFVANEVPVDLVRWMGWRNVRRALEEMIDLAKAIDPERLLTYANYPPTEWIAPRNADVFAINVYLHERGAYEGYLQHAHLLAGDRPVLVSEAGADVPREGESFQAEMMRWAYQSAADVGACGVCWFAWSGDWRAPDGGRNDDWDFGLVAADGTERQALRDAREWLEQCDGLPQWESDNSVSVAVVVCTRNGGERIARCLEALLASRRPADEIVVVDDGSTDDTAAEVRRFPSVKLVSIEPSGLSAARNRGAEETSADWIAYTDDDCQADPDWIGALVRHVSRRECGALGGPNVPPLSEAGGGRQWILDHAPGTANAVMMDDLRAEHLPGCNLVVRRDAFEAIGGFRRQYVTAGDDVDLCWRLIDAGFELHYVPSAMVWHERRPSLRKYLKQQVGYGRAEALLARDWAARVGSGGARWDGVVYGASGLAFDPAGVYGGAFASPGFPVLLAGNAPWDGAADIHVAGWLPQRWQMVARWMFKWQRWARAYGRWRGGLRMTVPYVVRGRSSELVELCDVLWVELSAGVCREEWLRGVVAELRSLGWVVEPDDGGQHWDLEVSVGSGRAPVQILTVAEVDGASGLNQVGVRIDGRDVEAVERVRAAVRAL
ncbi:glycosyltransferase [Sulfuriroseicoccus oceanibius]|uniref:Glycosyltransferase n=1 Tax=Sulfuriroseicoccus oceanibius TaxID=2707525 RepID=A0A7T7JD52_9BACT|nr:glycosyltransferase [Sulfuriroseicoccus oceanibius]QQL45970.1 glycosyltransferase [Sulfuriroseicoccus oceanibius]